MKYFAIIFAALLCGISAFPRKDEVQCQAPNGGGITVAIKEFIDMLPIDKILEVYLNAVSNDPEVLAVMEYLGSQEFRKIIAAVTSVPEFEKLVKMACEDLYLDVIYYLNVLNEILGLPTVPRPIYMNVPRRTGFHGMIWDILDLIDIDAVKEKFIEISKTDEYVKKALEMIKSQDFQNIIDSLHKTPAYNNMLSDLRRMGVKVDEIIEFIRKYFAW